MIAYPDTSLLCALYRQQTNSPAAARYFKKMPEPLHVTALLLFEFRQSIRFQGCLHAKDPGRGFSFTDGAGMLADLATDLSSGAVVVVTAEWAEVHAQAERLSAQHTPPNGHRAFDILHVATALHLGASEFLTFDANQRILAGASGLNVKP